MMTIKKLTNVFAFLCLIASNSLLASDSNQKLFVNLTSDEMNRATMAIAYSTMVLTQKDIPVTIFLSVEGARIIDMTLPEHRNGYGKSLKEMLSEFMEEGGRVLLCGMCALNVGGIDEDDVLSGVQYGDGMSDLFEDDTTVLTY